MSELKRRRAAYAAARSRAAHRKPLKQPSEAELTVSLGSIGLCWCGEEHGHPWPGRDEGAPHPREAEGTDSAAH